MELQTLAHESTTEPVNTAVDRPPGTLERTITIGASIDTVQQAWVEAGIPGKVSFTQAPADKGVEVKVVLEDAGPKTKIGSAMDAIDKDSLQSSIATAMRHLKQRLETGEIATVMGQPSARLENERVEK